MALEKGLGVEVMLFETLGGFSPDFVKVLKEAAAEVDNKLTHSQYDEATWSTRTWTTFAAQRIACALLRAVSTEVAHALSLTTARDPRARLGGG